MRVCTHVANDLYPYFIHVEESEDRAKTQLSDTLSRLSVQGALGVIVLEFAPLMLDCVYHDSSQKPSVNRNDSRHVLGDYVEAAVQRFRAADVSQRRQRVGAIQNERICPQGVHLSRWFVNLVRSGYSGLAMNIRNAPCDCHEHCGDQQQSHARPCTRLPIFDMPRTVAVVSSRELRSNHTHTCCDPAAQTYQLGPKAML